jgi:hypothetical protein
VFEEDLQFEILWKMYFDGECAKCGSGVGVIFEGPTYKVYPHSSRFPFKCMNNVTEYEELVQGLLLAQENGLSMKNWFKDCCWHKKMG